MIAGTQRYWVGTTNIYRHSGAQTNFVGRESGQFVGVRGAVCGGVGLVCNIT